MIYFTGHAPFYHPTLSKCWGNASVKLLLPLQHAADTDISAASDVNVCSVATASSAPDHHSVSSSKAPGSNRPNKSISSVAFSNTADSSPFSDFDYEYMKLMANRGRLAPLAQQWDISLFDVLLVSCNALGSLTLLVGRREWHLACKNWVLVC